MGSGWIIETLLMTRIRSAPAASTPWLNAARMVTSRQKRKRATANEPRVRVVRTFRRVRLAKRRGRNFMAALVSSVRKDAFVQVQRGVGALGRPRIVRDHQDGLAQLADETLEQVQDLVRAPPVQVARGLVAEEEGGVGHDRARDGHALLLSARELARLVVGPAFEAHHLEHGLDVLPALGGAQRREQQRQLDVA